MKRFCFTVLAALMLGLIAVSSAHAQQGSKKPNIVIIWGDDIGLTNLSAYSHGLLAPNVSRERDRRVIGTKII